VAYGAGFDGGHRETKGLSPAGQVILVPEHEHEVTLDFSRFELSADYGLGDGWHAWLRVPYDVKRRRARVRATAPATPAEREAQERNLELHHPTETLEGFGDLHLLGVRKARDLLFPRDVLVAAAGTSLPTGRTEEDPYERGRAGLPHEHVQFGTGTFDPLLELYYTVPLLDGLHLSLSEIGRFPLVENPKDYQGPVEVSATLGLGYRLAEPLSAHAGWSTFYQGYARWDGGRDVNSGLVSHGVTLGGTYALGGRASVSLSVRVPVSQRTLSDEGDTFEQGILLQLGVSYAF